MLNRKAYLTAIQSCIKFEIEIWKKKKKKFKSQQRVTTLKSSTPNANWKVYLEKKIIFIVSTIEMFCFGINLLQTCSPFAMHSSVPTLILPAYLFFSTLPSQVKADVTKHFWNS